MLSTIGEQCFAYATVKNLTVSFKIAIEDEECSGKPVSVSTPINSNAVYNMILSDRQIRLKKVSKALMILYKRFQAN